MNSVKQLLFQIAKAKDGLKFIGAKFRGPLFHQKDLSDGAGEVYLFLIIEVRSCLGSSI